MRHHLRSRLFVCALVAATATGCSQEDPAELLKKADAALSKGEFSTAEIHLKNLLQKQDENAQARLMLARTYAARRNWPSAEKEFRRAMDLGAGGNQTAPGLLEAMFHLGDAGKVIQQAGMVSVDDPLAQAAVRYWTARAWIKQGDAAKAKLGFEEALKFDPSLVKARVGLLGLEARHGGEAIAGALAALGTLLRDAPDSHEALMLQAELRFALGDLKGARVPLEAVIANTPSDVFARSTLIEIDFALRDLPAARSHLAQLLKLAPRWPVAQTQMAQLNLHDGKLEAARDGALEALKTAPDYMPAVAIAGAAMLAQGSFEQAETYARQLVKLAPALPNGHRLLGATLLKRGEAGRALQVVEPLVQGDTADAQLLVIAGEAALRNGNATDSAKYFARAANLDKQDAGSRVGLALARLGTGDRAGALEDLRTASTLNSESTAADQILVATLINEREFDRALHAIKQLEEKQPASGEAAYLRGRVALAQNDAVRARSYFEQALVVAPTLLPVTATLAALDVKEGKTGDARLRFETFVKAEPKNAPALLGLAKLTADTGGAQQEVLDLLRRARDADPNNEAAALALAQALVTQGQAREAVEVLQQAAKQHPTWIRALEALAGAHMAAGEPQRANEVVDRVARLKPDDPGVQFRMGTFKTTLRDYKGALERYMRAQALRPDAIEPKVSIALSQARLGRFDEALATGRKLQKELAGSPVGWALEGEIHRIRQKWQEATIAFRKAMDIDASQRTNAIKLHDSLIRAGSAAEAERLLQGWLKETPKDETLNLYAGERALLGKRFPEAVRHYEEAIEANPGNVGAHNNLAWSLYQLKDPKALAAAEEAYRLAPNSAAVVDTLATILSDAKQAKRGLEMHRRAATLAPKSADLRLKLARALKDSGDKVEARRELDAVIRDFPGTPQATTAGQLSAEL